ncbi:YIP1 family protein [Aliiglaciecola sp. CAU 1673]|uniref:YIP1 family protein n=1 Tax=Aliiglaciecola sp. CAU 1673 TaxID=3032595 RepID=UPI0023DB1856|nr:YIP1 family protein [Aliiglaciecola sp. CAU 1673]MDF2180257.1 YIP1 family protein [Aliiglaciecola sp. CAU 1673]
MRSVNDPFTACYAVLFKPNQVFATLARANNWSWIPFLLLMLMSVLPAFIYFNVVDFEWYRDFIISQQFADISPAEQENVRRNLTPGGMITLTLFTSALGLIALNALQAMYLNTMARMDQEQVHGFADWFGLMWWVSLPAVVGNMLSLLILVLSGNDQFPPAQLSVTSLSYWLSVPMDSPWFTLAQVIRLESFWSIYLIAVAITKWTNIRSNTAWNIAIGPYVVIWGLWSIAIVW